MVKNTKTNIFKTMTGLVVQTKNKIKFANFFKNRYYVY